MVADDLEELLLAVLANKDTNFDGPGVVDDLMVQKLGLQLLNPLVLQVSDLLSKAFHVGRAGDFNHVDCWPLEVESNEVRAAPFRAVVSFDGVLRAHEDIGVFSQVSENELLE